MVPRLPSAAAQNRSERQPMNGRAAVAGVGVTRLTRQPERGLGSLVEEAVMAALDGILNMTRGRGTALGLALTGLVFGLAARAGSDAMFSAASATAAAFLAAIAFTATGLALVRAPARSSPRGRAARPAPPR